MRVIEGGLADQNGSICELNEPSLIRRLGDNKNDMGCLKDDHLYKTRAEGNALGFARVMHRSYLDDLS
jgi:hypothetical protein